jgi:hypothetical protein
MMRFLLGGRYTRIILALMLGLIIIAVSECSEVPSKVVPASEILSHIQKDVSVEYDNIMAKGNLNLSERLLESEAPCIEG